MTREHKHVIIYGAFGLLLGTKIVEVLLTRTDTGIIDWWLLLIGVGAAIVHYLPVNEKSEPGDDTRKNEPKFGEEEDTLVLRDHSHPQRSGSPRRDAAPVNRSSPSRFL
ncbi:hypothetical protein GGR28_003056 [Lewinella aquimaris]|uniref:Uncharacterized protein n=1 Tax=Neolewinella aquimaris TaxID=1835722 RepID=A0A840E9M0_9BACT|nr:hypothetical protein [Neolewinella aquimaris]MBB4080422.1 hypothetical protein [Neolewinella aquimaris]